ncbi:MAG: AAA family ATPase [Gammaproteobacteria bacterium]|nr:AAA family ATPase [Gammaproteobacteria bacterium]
MSFNRTLRFELPGGQSAFLWGARQTGKSTLLRTRFPNAPLFDLLDFDLRFRFAARPSRFAEELASKSSQNFAGPVIIDEIQKVPALLDEVHRLIETRGLSFVLCGSSAVKLKRAGVNLLGGRAWRYELFPLTYPEVPNINLLQAMNRGLLPAIYTKTQHRRSLSAYTRDYLAQEVMGEGLTRNVEVFSRFFEALKFCHGELLNYAAIARDCGVSAKTVRTYFEILQDTLIAHLIYPFRRHEGRQSIIAAPKFYLFDLGVANQVCKRSITSATGSEFGKAFEHFLLLEIIAARSYQEKDYPIQFWRTKSGLEVDFVLAKGEVAVEAKSRVRANDLRSMRAFVEECAPRRAIVVSAEEDRRMVDGIEIMPHSHFLELLHEGEIL